MGLYGASLLGWTELQFQAIDALLFGSLIAATDPVATLSVFQKVCIVSYVFSVSMRQVIVSSSYRSVARSFGELFTLLCCFAVFAGEVLRNAVHACVW